MYETFSRQIYSQQKGEVEVSPHQDMNERWNEDEKLKFHTNHIDPVKTIESGSRPQPKLPASARLMERLNNIALTNMQIGLTRRKNNGLPVLASLRTHRP